MNLSSAKRNINIAQSEVNKMRATTSFSQLQESWENFLMRLEKAWEITDRLLRSKKGFQQWNAPYSQLRKKDPLLVYLKQARNSDMHSISNTMDKPLKFSIRDKSGHGFSLKSISSTYEDSGLTINLESDDFVHDLDASIVPTDPELLRVQNRGKWFNPPKWHLKNRLVCLHPVSIAEKGLSFYKGYIEEAEHWLRQT